MIFWRWPSQIRSLVRDGIRPYYVHHLPTNKKKTQSPPADRKTQIWDNFKKAITRGYLTLIDSEEVKNFIDNFHIPKGEEDIRVVLNGTRYGLTKAVFAPNYWLLYSPVITRILHFGYKSVDMDVGKCFLNFNLHRELVPYSAVDLSHFKK